MKKSTVFVFGLAVGLCVGVAPIIPSFVAAMRETPPTSKNFDNAVLAQLPFSGRWLVSQGGENKKDNVHWGIPPQDLALDIRGVVDESNGDTRRGDPTRNESYGCWSRRILAPISGKVLVAVDGVPDNIPGELNQMSALGNHVIIQDPRGFFVVMCHFRRDSVVVKAGQEIQAGEFVALCGNSGRSTEPHLHLHVQSGPVMAKSVTMRIVFSSAVVSGSIVTNYTPKKGDVLSSAKERSNEARRSRADAWLIGDVSPPVLAWTFTLMPDQISSQIERLRAAYTAFNARDIGAAVALMTPDVAWPKAFKGGIAQGPEEIRAYWTEQWSEINPNVEPVSFRSEGGECILVDVHQVVRDLAGAVLLDQHVGHRFTFRNGLIQAMEVVHFPSNSSNL